VITFNLDKDKNNWQIKSLGELLTSLESGGRATGGSVSYGIPSIGAEHLDDFGKLNFSSMKYVPKDYYYSMNKGKIFKGDILVVKDGATTGKVSFIDNDFPFPESAVNEHVFIVRTNKHLLDPQFAFYYLYSSIGKLQILTDFRGSAQGGISRGFVDKVHLPLPPLSIQKQIAEILEKVDTAKQKRQEANKLTVEFLQSVFIEMFGDPVKNPKGWDMIHLGEVISVLMDYHSNGSYETLRNNVKLLDTPDYAYMIRTTDLEKQDYETDVKYVSKSSYEFLKKSKIFGGEIIINKIGSAGQVYLMPYLNRKVSLGMNQFGLRFNEKANNIYIYFLLKSSYGESIIKKKVQGAVTKTITKEAVRSLIIPLPPLSLQQQFAEIVNKTEALKEKQKQSEQELENLFQCLMQRAFKGELV